MTSPPAHPDDRAARRTAARDFDRNLVVVAGAGTGKTSLLVERILNAIGTGKASIEEIAAITFTKKAAAEMKHRLAAGLERLLRLAGDSGAVERDRGREADRSFEYLTGDAGLEIETVGRRALEALTRLDRATVETIHTFCASLLRAYPMEAGVDPRFEVDEGARFRGLLEDRWESFLLDELGSRAPRIDLWRRVLDGFTIGTVGIAAGELAGFGVPDGVLDRTGDPVDARDLFGDRAASLLETVKRILALNPDMNVRTVPKFEAMRDGLDLFLRRGREALAEFVGGHDSLRGWIAKGSRPKRTRSLEGVSGEEYETTGKETFQLFGQLHAADDERISDMVEAVAPFIRDVRERFLAQGFVGFDGLLVLARDLLRDHPRIREAIRKRYRMLLVDEFQDTDPLQYEIVLYLGEAEGGKERDAYRVGLEPGRLFIVGDPKQSIYRFRGADYEAFERAVKKIAPEEEDPVGVELDLTRNFRSRPEVLEPINALFEAGSGGGWLEAEPYQPCYKPIHAHREGANEPRVEVWTVGGGRQIGAEERRSLEGIAIAAWIRDLEETGYRRVTILLRAFTNLSMYLQPLRQTGIPYVVDGGKNFMERPETTHLLAAMKTLLRPADQAALLSFLRSPAGGASDVDLAGFLADGGRWDWRREIADPGAHPAVAGAFALLRSLHDEIRDVHPEEVVRRVLDGTGLLELSACAYEGPQRIANLRKLALQVSGLTRDGRMSLLEAVEYLEEDTTSDVESESPMADETTDAVRILTVHKAKGLENDIVIVPDLAGGRNRRQEDSYRAVSLPGNREALAVRAGGVPNSARIWLDREEEEHETAEDVRLLYVAMTRARERLILVAGNPNQSAPWIEALEPWGYSPGTPPADGAVLGVPSGVIHRRVDTGDTGAKAGGEEVHGAPEAVEAYTRAVETARAASMKPFRAPSGLKTEAKVERREEDPETLGTGVDVDRDVALLTGTVVHRALESWDRRDGRSLLDLAGRLAAGSDELPAASRERVTAEATSVLESFLTFDLAQALRNADLLGREVPILLDAGDGTVFRGSIDLLYRGPDGLPVVADFKTDDTDDPVSLAGRYREQLQVYARAVQAAMELAERPLTELWHLRSGRRIAITPR